MTCTWWDRKSDYDGGRKINRGKVGSKLKTYVTFRWARWISLNLQSHFHLGETLFFARTMFSLFFCQNSNLWSRNVFVTLSRNVRRWNFFISFWGAFVGEVNSEKALELLKSLSSLSLIWKIVKLFNTFWNNRSAVVAFPSSLSLTDYCSHRIFPNQSYKTSRNPKTFATPQQCSLWVV